jgi:subtilisin family serine protease
VAIAVIDTGLGRTHPDIAPNLFVNPGEVAGNGRDDDGNGYVDDVSGYDFVQNDGVPQDADGHGTHVAGTAAGNGNDGIGVTGVAWRSSILPLRVLGDDGTGTVADVVRAYGYVKRMGIKLVNLSLGGLENSRAERDALAAAASTLFVTAAGNEGTNNDTVGSYPCSHDLANIVCVAATDQDDTIASFSNRGATSVDLAAPGVNIAGPWPDGSWVYLDGTSMATPIVTGTAALLLARKPDASVATLKRALLDGVDAKGSLAGLVATGGRLNAAGALAELDTDVTVAGAQEQPAGSTGEQSASTATAPSEPQPAPSQPAPAAPAQPQPQPSAPPPGQTAAPRTAAPSTELRDRRAPLVGLPVARVRGGRVRLALRCDEPCTLRVELRRGTKALTRKTRAGSGTVTLTVAKRDRKAKLSLRIVATDRSGNRRTIARRVA